MTGKPRGLDRRTCMGRKSWSRTGLRTCWRGSHSSLDPSIIRILPVFIAVVYRLRKLCSGEGRFLERQNGKRGNSECYLSLEFCSAESAYVYAVGQTGFEPGSARSHANPVDEDSATCALDTSNSLLGAVLVPVLELEV